MKHKCFCFHSGRDMIWSPRNKRPERLRDSIKEVEVIFVCVCVCVCVCLHVHVCLHAYMHIFVLDMYGVWLHVFIVVLKLQALACNILPSTTAVFSYAIGFRKLSANEQFYVGARTVGRLLQTAQIKQGVSFIAANKVYTSTNKTTIVWIEMELLFSPGVDASHVYMCALVLGCFYSHISPRTFRKALTVLLDSCAEIKSAPSAV